MSISKKKKKRQKEVGSLATWVIPHMQGWGWAYPAMPGSCSSPASRLCTVFSEKGPAVPTPPAWTPRPHPRRSPSPEPSQALWLSQGPPPPNWQEDDSRNRELQAQDIRAGFWALLSMASGLSLQCSSPVYWRPLPRLNVPLTHRWVPYSSETVKSCSLIALSLRVKHRPGTWQMSEKYLVNKWVIFPQPSITWV